MITTARSFTKITNFLNFNRTLFKNLTYSFANDLQKGQMQAKILQNQKKNSQIQREVQIQEKYHKKSAKLYDKYIKSRSKPIMTLDNYQIHYSLIITRLPIFYPYHKKTFQAYKNHYQFQKKTGYFIPYGKDMQIQSIDFSFGQYQKRNPQNILTHITYQDGNRKQIYSQKSRYWRMVDPDVKDDKSIQNYSSDFVYFIIKDKNGNWRFPSRPLTQLQTHDQFFNKFQKQLFIGSVNSLTFFGEKKPVLATKKEDDSLQRGVGVLNLFYKGININGIAQFPTQLFDDYVWVPKPHLGKYFDDQYFSQVIRSVHHEF